MPDFVNPFVQLSPGDLCVTTRLCGVVRSQVQHALGGVSTMVSPFYSVGADGPFLRGNLVVVLDSDSLHPECLCLTAFGPALVDKAALHRIS